MHWTSSGLGSLAFVFLPAIAPAQISATAAVTQPIVMQVSGSPNATRAIGPIPVTGALVTTGVNHSQSQLQIALFAPLAPLGAIGWEVNTDLRAATAFGSAPVSASVTGRLEFVFSASQSRAGVLRLLPQTWTGSNSPATGAVTIDLGCDGVPEYSAETATYTELPLTVGPSGVRICLDLAFAIAVSPQPGVNVIGGAYRNWQMEFVPDVYGVEPFATGCVGGFRWDRAQGTGELSLSLFDPNAPGPGPTIGGAFLLVGLGATAVPLPLPPFCTQLVAAPTLVAPVWVSPWTLQWRVPALQLPPGLVFHAQAVWWNYSGSLFATTALRSF